MRIGAPFIAAALLASSVFSTSARADDLPMTAEEFKLWRDYQGALEDPRVQKMSDKERLPKIAANFRVPMAKLQAAIAKGEKVGDQVGPAIEAAVQASLDGTELAGRIKRIKIDASAAHIIAYVTWLPDRPEMIDREACIVAARVHKASDFIGTIKVEVSNPGAAEEGHLFEALISASSADKIQEEKIIDFASTRYIKLFEKVKRAKL